MLRKPTINELRAAGRLNALPEWREVANMIEGELQEIYLRLSDTHNVVVLHQLQGRAQALKDFRIVMANALDYLERMSK